MKSLSPGRGRGDLFDEGDAEEDEAGDAYRPRRLEVLAPEDARRAVSELLAESRTNYVTLDLASVARIANALSQGSEEEQKVAMELVTEARERCVAEGIKHGALASLISIVIKLRSAGEAHTLFTECMEHVDFLRARHFGYLLMGYLEEGLLTKALDIYQWARHEEGKSRVQPRFVKSWNEAVLRRRGNRAFYHIADLPISKLFEYASAPKDGTPAKPDALIARDFLMTQFLHDANQTRQPLRPLTHKAVEHFFRK